MRKTKIAPKISKAILLVALAAACNPTPKYSPPETAATKSASFKNAPKVAAKKQSMSRWWEHIDDPLLKGYVDELLSQNLDLKAAALRVVQAQESLNIETGNTAPTLDLELGASRTRSAKTATGTRPTYTNAYEATLSSSWELDLFGRLRQSVVAANKEFLSKRYDQEALTHSLIAELLRRRISIATQKELLMLSQKTIENRKRTYELVKKRYDLGAKGISLVDVYLAKEKVSSVEADTHEFERLLKEQVYYLDTLLGKAPGSTDPLKEDFPLLSPPKELPVGLPAQLLDRRPDLKASQLRIEAANAEVGVSIAELYPSLTLGASIGFSSSKASNLFTADQLAGSILGSLFTRLFEGGKLRANIRLKKAKVQELAHSYAQGVLNAMREVETALYSEQRLTEELNAVSTATDALIAAENASAQRYERGIETLRDYLDTQQQRYQIEKDLLSLQEKKWDTRTSLYLALGGDWLKNSSQPSEARDEQSN